MANTDNECKNLKIAKDNFKAFEELFKKQAQTQEKTYKYDFKSMTIAEVARFWLMNKHALEDELSEMFDALGGINDGIGNAAWKPWKKSNEIAKRITTKDLTESDRKELLFEMADAFIFLMNFPISAGFTGNEIANAIKTKIDENIDRQKRGY